MADETAPAVTSTTGGLRGWRLLLAALGCLVVLALVVGALWCVADQLGFWDAKAEGVEGNRILGNVTAVWLAIAGVTALMTGVFVQFLEASSRTKASAAAFLAATVMLVTAGLIGWQSLPDEPIAGVSGPTTTASTVQPGLTAQ